MKQDLRDKLLKAGLVDKKAKKRADHRARLKRTEDQKAGVNPDEVLEQKEREYEAKLAEQRRRDKERELARHREQQERERIQAADETRETAEKQKASERRQEQYQARDLLQANMFLPQAPGPVPFHFVSRSGGIRKLSVSTRIAHDLKSGQLAIAQLPGPGAERFGLVRRDVAERLLAMDESLVRFFVRDTQAEMVEMPPVVEDQVPRGKGVRRFGLKEKGAGERRDR